MKTFTSLADPAVRRLLIDGAVGVLPGDTVYGVMARAASPEAISKLFAAKQRDGKPGTIIAADIDQLVGLGLKRRYLTAVAQYWPGAVSVVVPCGPELEYLHQSTQGLAVRVPDSSHTQLLELLQATGPLMTSSANVTGQPTATTIGQAKDSLGDAVDFYVDGGDLSGRLPSTVLRIVDDAVEILREGAVKIET